MALIQSLIDSSKYDIKCPYSMIADGICVHNTANDATAENEVAYMKRNNNEVSFHIAIDDVQSIQVIPFNRNAWAAGDGGSGAGNRKHIHIEICYSKSGGAKFVEAEKRAAKEIAALLKQFNWGINKVKKHQDFSGKYCPHRTLDMGWQRFLDMISKELNGTSSNAPVVSNEVYRVRKTWADASSQKGAYKDLNNAKTECDKYPGYSVFNSSGIAVYTAVSASEIYRIRKTWTDAGSQKGAYKDLNSAKKECDKYPGYSVFNSAGVAVYSVPEVTKSYVNLKPHMAKWAVYNQNGPYTLANKIGEVKPQTYGGLSYEILGEKGNDVYIIQTQTYGKVGIWVPKDNDSSFTSSPLYN